MTRFLVVPGWGGSDDDHWQSCWTRADSRFEVVEQDDWDGPDLGVWIERLDRAVHRTDGPVVLVAHSLGVHLVARWAQVSDSTPVRAALLVAPPDIDHSVARGAAPIAPFGPASSTPLPFPALLAASETDPWAPLESSARLAQDWAARFVNVGDCGHINSASGHGSWPHGLDLLGELTAST
jgi:predicted alpha/beta hydrolase family esterase